MKPKYKDRLIEDDLIANNQQPDLKEFNQSQGGGECTGGDKLSGTLEIGKSKDYPPADLDKPSYEEELKEKDPLDELFLNEKETDILNEGKRIGKLEKEREFNNLDYNLKIKNILKEKDKEIKTLNKSLNKITLDRDYWKKKVGWTEEREIKLEKRIEKMELAGGEE